MFNNVELIFNKHFFEISKAELDDVHKLYQHQLPNIYQKFMEHDNNLMIILAIGRKNRFDYLQYLVDHYYRSDAVDVSTWTQNYAHFKNLEKISLKLLYNTTPCDLAKHAI
eukprot:219888_1